MNRVRLLPATLRPALAGALLMSAAAMWLVSSSAMPKASMLEASNGSIPNRAVKVAGGQSGDSSWGIWLFGEGGRGCWGTRTRHRGELTGESVTCGFSVPLHRFQLAATGTLADRVMRVDSVRVVGACG